MSTLSLAVSFNPANRDLSGIHFTQDKSGYIHSPWFTYDCRKDLKAGRPFYGFSNQMARIMGAARNAFAAAVDIDVNYVVLTEKREAADDSFQWRVSTARPWKLPEKHTPPKRASLAQAGDIEIDASPALPRLK